MNSFREMNYKSKRAASSPRDGHLCDRSGHLGSRRLLRSSADRSSPCHSEYCNIVSGVFTPVLAKHTKHLSLVDILAVGVDRIQRNFEPMTKQVEA